MLQVKLLAILVTLTVVSVVLADDAAGNGNSAMQVFNGLQNVATNIFSVLRVIPALIYESLFGERGLITLILLGLSYGVSLLLAGITRLFSVDGLFGQLGTLLGVVLVGVTNLLGFFSSTAQYGNTTS